MTKLQLSLISALLFSVHVQAGHIEHENTYSSATNIKKTAEALDRLENEDPRLFYNAWNTPIAVSPFVFFTSNNNISLEQIPYPKVEFTSEQIYDNGMVFDFDVPTLKKEYNLASNELRMKQGRRPLGPDGKPLVLCSLTSKSDASYVEMSASQWGKAMTILEIDSNASDNYCLSDKMSERYWKARFHQLVDGSNHAKRSRSIKQRS